MKKIASVLFAIIVSAGLTWDEVSLYGSRIIVCDNDTVIKHWVTMQEGESGRPGSKRKIFDLFTKKSYPIGNCELYKCSPEPWRMKGCELPK